MERSMGRLKLDSNLCQPAISRAATLRKMKYVRFDDRDRETLNQIVHANDERGDYYDPENNPFQKPYDQTEQAMKEIVRIEKKYHISWVDGRPKKSQQRFQSRQDFYGDHDDNEGQIDTGYQHSDRHRTATAAEMISFHGDTFTAKPVQWGDFWDCAGCGLRIQCLSGSFCKSCILIRANKLAGRPNTGLEFLANLPVPDPTDHGRKCRLCHSSYPMHSIDCESRSWETVAQQSQSIPSGAPRFTSSDTNTRSTFNDAISYESIFGSPLNSGNDGSGRYHTSFLQYGTEIWNCCGQHQSSPGCQRGSQARHHRYNYYQNGGPNGTPGWDCCRNPLKSADGCTPGPHPNPI